MALVIYLNTERRQWWLEHLQSLLPGIDCRLWENAGDPGEILYAVVWRPPTGGLARFPNLRCIISVGAGIDHVLQDSLRPEHVPVIRTTGSDLTLRMREYVCLHVLRMHRRSMEIEARQQQQLWQPGITPTAAERRIGIMGLGKLGSDAAVSLAALGFSVAGWANSRHRISNVDTYAGVAEKKRFLRATEILVCMLPLTESTRGILNRDLFAQLPAGACIINVARGEHLIENDLTDAIAHGHIDYATLDVFIEEPLPADHPFWHNPRITVTPHIASMIDPESGGKEIARNLQRFINGETISDLTDADRGY